MPNGTAYQYYDFADEAIIVSDGILGDGVSTVFTASAKTNGSSSSNVLARMTGSPSRGRYEIAFDLTIAGGPKGNFELQSVSLSIRKSGRCKAESIADHVSF